MTPTPALAGAWIAPEGGQEIWTNAAGQRDDAAFFETSAYWEIPVGKNNSFVAAPWFENNVNTDEGWRAEAVVGLKQAVFRDDQTVMALQVGALWVSAPGYGCGEGGVEARWLGGRSLGDGAFVNLEVAARALEGGCVGERLDITAGYRPSENWLAMGQIFFDAPRDGDETVKAQLTLVRFGERGRGIQVGLRARIDGGPQEPTLVVGLWGRPGD
ncbi:hypothetical protein [Terricaulis silvestris]|uniref:Uncharacterized protein n=1 Tax=Terricaulis silvestris TaxID=2686094 RepID=A0A6I6MIN2_9CAUL|nr:hypothetical protein [Terricaulis silvestris]QGZ94985.1 hypothetical protein DSM104635_01821 [Terricaulis silvestris]